jgi:hypothetical protein
MRTTEKASGKHGRTILLVGAGCALCLAFVAARIARIDSEPRYGGRPLHAWIEDINEIAFSVTRTSGINLEGTNAAVMAILATGDHAIPWLRSELRSHDSMLRTRLRKLAYHLPPKLGGIWAVRQLTPSNPTLWQRHRRAAMAALILGGRAKPVAPDLAELLNSGDDCTLYTYALSRMGQDGVPALTQALTNRETSIRDSALTALQLIDANLEPAVPALLQVLTNGGGFPIIKNIFVKAQGASNAIIPVAALAAHHTRSNTAGPPNQRGPECPETGSTAIGEIW